VTGRKRVPRPAAGMIAFMQSSLDETHSRA
jgi:hypothetical protein